MNNKTQILKRSEVEKRYGLSRSTIYRLVERGEFPKPVRLTSHSVGWLESQLEEWLNNRIKAS